MKKLALILLSISILSSCISENPNEKAIPKISPSDFQSIIKKVWLLNAHVQNNNKYSLIHRDSISQITLEILSKNGYDKEDLIQTINYYSSKPIALDSLIKDLGDTLEKNKIKIPHEKEEENKKSPNDSLDKLIDQETKLNSRKLNKNLNFNKTKKDSLLKKLDRQSKNISNRKYNSIVKKLNDSLKMKK